MSRIPKSEFLNLEKAVFRKEKGSKRSIISVPYNYDSFTRNCHIASENHSEQSSGSTILDRIVHGKILGRRHKKPLLNNAQAEALSLAALAKKHIDGMVGLMNDALQTHFLGDSVDMTYRAKSLLGITNKTENAINKYCDNIDENIIEVQQDPKIKIDHLLPQIDEKTSQKSKNIIANIRRELDPLETEDGIPLVEAETKLNNMNLERQGRHGKVILKRLRRNIESQKKQLVHNFFEKVAYEQAGINEIGKNVRDQQGFRFIIKPMSEAQKAKIQHLPAQQRIEATKKYMDKQVRALLDMLVEQKDIHDIQMVRMTNYSGRGPQGKATSYVSEAELERLELTVSGLRREDKSTNSGYPCFQMNLVQKQGRETVRLEIQIRGTEVQKVGEAEHLIYDPREGKKLELAKYKKEHHSTIIKIDQEARKLAKNPEQDKLYSQYLSDYYYHAFAKEHGIDVPAPKLPEGINPLLDMEVLLNVTQ